MKRKKYKREKRLQNSSWRLNAKNYAERKEKRTESCYKISKQLLEKLLVEGLNKQI